MVEVKLKAKYRQTGSGKKTPYRSRTGPHCCCNHRAGNCCTKRR